MNSIRKILILGSKPAGTLDILNYAKSLGLYTIVCDYINKEKSLAKQLADESWDISTNNVLEIAQKAKDHNVSAVFTGIHEFNINRCLEVCQILNLPFYASANNIFETSNKYIYKKIMERMEIPTILEYDISNINNIPKNIQYPILLKPIDSSGAYGLQICNSADEIIQKLPICLTYSTSKRAIAERYIDNKEEITSIYIIKDGIPYLASVADRIVKTFNADFIPLPVEYLWNSKFLDLYIQTTCEKMKQTIRHLNLKNGMLFIQSIVKDQVIMPYDIGFRLSATQENVILEAQCGYNPLKLLVDYSISGEFGDKDLINKINPYFKSPAAQITFLVKPSTITCFKGLEKIEQMKNVIRVIKNKTEGETVPNDALGTLNQVALRIFLQAPNQKALKDSVHEIKKHIEILSSSYENIIIH